MTRRQHRNEKVHAVSNLFQQFFETLGIHDGNPEVDLSNTPDRIAKMYVDELLNGYDDNALHELKARFTVFNAARVHEMVVIKGTQFTSLCAHHLMPFYGTIDLGYIPDKKVIGLSKFPRAVRLFSARLQTQENLVSQLADFVMELAKPHSLIVKGIAHHLCCGARGIRQPNVSMVTSAVRGNLPDGVKLEFYNLLQQ